MFRRTTLQFLLTPSAMRFCASRKEPTVEEKAYIYTKIAEIRNIYGLRSLDINNNWETIDTVTDPEKYVLARVSEGMPIKQALADVTIHMLADDVIQEMVGIEAVVPSALSPKPRF